MRNAIGKTDIGMCRENNEDSLLVLNESIGRLNDLYIVADGMGGHNAGEVASSLAINVFCDYVKEQQEFVYIEDLLAGGVRHANQRIHQLSLERAEHHGMGTTFTVASVDDKNLYYAHVGDSRLYVISGGNIRQLTEDHTYVNELVKSGSLSEADAATHPDRNILMRALGTNVMIKVDQGYYPLVGDEKFVMCSDGLSGYLSNNDILNIVNGEGDDEAKLDAMVERALRCGGADNISVILITSVS